MFSNTIGHNSFFLYLNLFKLISLKTTQHVSDLRFQKVCNCFGYSFWLFTLTLAVFEILRTYSNYIIYDHINIVCKKKEQNMKLLNDVELLIQNLKE